MTNVRRKKANRRRSASVSESVSQRAAVAEPAGIGVPGLGRAQRYEWFCALGSALVLWAAFPPLNGWPLAWLAPLGWLHLIRRPTWSATRPYRVLYLSGFAHWVLLVQWIRLPHWSAHFGWIVLAAYLATYIPLFVAVTRCLVHRCCIPMAVAAPVVWTALEWVRSWFLTGFPLSLLGHTQLPFTSVVQIADVLGAYGVSFIVLFVPACGYEVVWNVARGGRRKIVAHMVAAIGCVAIVLGYAAVRISQFTNVDQNRQPFRVALVQGSLDTQFDGDRQRIQDAFFDYVDLARQAVTERNDLDLLVWPESMFTATEEMVSYSEPLVSVPDWDGTVEAMRALLDERKASVEARFEWVTQLTKTPMLVGIEWDHYDQGRTLRHNSAVLVDTQGQLRGRYDKMHPVMFGEYIAASVRLVSVALRSDADVQRH